MNQIEIGGQLAIRRFEFWRFGEWPWPFAVLENLKTLAIHFEFGHSLVRSQIE